MTSLILQTAMRLLLPLGLLFGAYMTLKGHNAPGGGFIGGLVIAVVLALYRMAFGPVRLQRMLPVHPRVLVMTGLALAAFSAVFPLLLGYPTLQSYNTDIPLPFGEQAHFASALIFDLGVVLVVVGVSIGMITRLSEELQR